MLAIVETSGNVVHFRYPRLPVATWRDQKGFMEAVYTAGSLPVQAGDRETKLMASRLQLFGFVTIEEIEANGTPRRLRPSETFSAPVARPWRISKPSAGRA